VIRCGGLPAAALIFFVAAANAAPPRSLSDDQWREDIQQAASAIKETHPAPFRNVKEEQFDAETAALIDRLPDLSDREIFVQLARLVSLLKDGHTRLVFARKQASRSPALEVGHNPGAFEGPQTLIFDSLPVKFALFDDGLFIVSATREHRALVGARVVAFDDTPVDAALEKVFDVSFADNAWRARALAPSRLEMPDVLAALGIAAQASSVRLQLQHPETGPRDVTLTPEDEELLPADSFVKTAPRWLSRTSELKFHEVLGDHKAIYVQLNEMEAFPREPIAGFVKQTFEDARKAGATRYVIDLRHNFGGSTQWNPVYVKAILQNGYDRFGRLYVLIGRNTYSAAASLVLSLLNYADPILVGEPMGEPPTHLGDPDRVRLKHSGLDLRISKIYWHSYLAGEFREAIPPFLPVRYESRHYFSGEDPVLAAALEHEAPAGIAAQMREFFDREQPQEAILHFFDYIANVNSDLNVEAQMLELGNRFLEEKRGRDARFVFLMVFEYLGFKQSRAAEVGLARALEMEGKEKEALERFRKVLEKDPANVVASEAVERLQKGNPE
jgi:hypothetical protein